MDTPFEGMAEEHLSVISRSGREWMCACPYCGRGSSLQFNIEKGLFNCFACGEGGSAKKLMKYLGAPYRSPGVSLDRLTRALEMLDSPATSSLRVLPDSYLARYGGKPHGYWTEGRKFTPATIREWELGFDPLGPTFDGSRVGPGVTIPFRNPEGGLLGVIFRRLDDGFPRYIYPRGFDRVGSLFGSWKLHHGDAKAPLVLVEGSTDAISVHQAGHRAAAQYGSSLSPQQAKLISQAAVQEVVLFYDYDPAGLKATKQAVEHLDGFLVRAVEWDSAVYCWHERVCRCQDNHTPLDRDFGRCPRKVQCRCGREHNPDPGKLTKEAIDRMVREAEFVGRPKWKTGSARSPRARASRKRA